MYASKELGAGQTIRAIKHLRLYEAVIGSFEELAQSRK